MLLSKLVGERIRENLSDIKIESQMLLLRAGFIKQVANGIYTLAAPANNIVKNIENIIREEMNGVDGQEVLFPVVLPRELLDESGRYNSIGSELVRFKDRNDKDYILAMTHEEAAVHFVKNAVQSYKQLPFMIYQIQTKFRDEGRPRGGLIRVREFTMKDGYSFHNSQQDLERYYDEVLEAYNRIFRRIGLKDFVVIKSDTGMMGGSVAHEFMLLTHVGEDEILLCDNCDYKANMEVAPESFMDTKIDKIESLSEVYTGTAKEILEICKLLKISPSETCKAVVFAVKGEKGCIIAFTRGDMEINEAKLKKVVGKNIVPWDGNDDDLVAGNIGPVNLKVKDAKIVFDNSLKNASNLICGANKKDYHLKGLSISRDLDCKDFYDISKARDGQSCHVCKKGKLDIKKGIEVGNIFQLGIKYTKGMSMSIIDDKGNLFYPIMGCYGIGVGRSLAAVAQESRDEKGLIWPMSIAPWKVHICALRLDEQDVSKKTYELYAKLKKENIGVLLDDRMEASAGVKFADADLMGMPIRLVISPKSLATNEVEIVLRDGSMVEKVPFDKAVATIKKLIK